MCVWACVHAFAGLDLWGSGFSNCSEYALPPHQLLPHAQGGMGCNGAGGYGLPLGNRSLPSFAHMAMPGWDWDMCPQGPGYAPGGLGMHPQQHQHQHLQQYQPPMKRLVGHAGAVLCIAVDEARQLLHSCGADCTIKTFQLVRAGMHCEGAARRVRNPVSLACSPTVCSLNTNGLAGCWPAAAMA